MGRQRPRLEISRIQEESAFVSYDHSTKVLASGLQHIKISVSSYFLILIISYLMLDNNVNLIEMAPEVSRTLSTRSSRIHLLLKYAQWCHESCC